MGNLLRDASLVFGAGAVGALANGMVIWFFGNAGITAALGVHIAPHITSPWLYHRIVWGGIWGALFLLGIYKSRPLRQGLLYSIAPTMVQLFVVFPYKTSAGMMGLKLGMLTPVFVLFFNAIWGIVAAYWLRLSGK
jgi:hypothetical protein